ncbi:pentatricopeptide repeat-containing protein At5g16860-like [Phalaenopsis equestris]|uniref:pentatricopeptide repeat-containing protein At5g16860-like n=1 Tax=Phalaenopsis equestris TaxID=78828 RepID=UPI0009E3E789|nr:pentatricopeptide repeat-containing protein At5g16860-like [Phalaenopsis equestris]
MAAVFSSVTPRLSPATRQHLPPFLRRDRNTLHLHSSSPPPGAVPTAINTSSIEHRIQESLSILDLMQSQSISPDSSLLCSILKRCADARSLRLGRLAHEKALLAGLHTDPFVANSLLLLYSRCGLLSTARKLFDEMPLKNVVSWTTAISMYHHAGLPHEAIKLYQLMCNGTDGASIPVCKPNCFTYTTVLNCCASVKDVELGVTVHKQIVDDGLQNDNFITVALIDMYTKCGQVCDARKVFDSISEPSIEASTAMIEGYSGNGQPKEAADVLRMVLRSGPVAEVVMALGFSAMIRPFFMEEALRHGQEIHAHIIKSGHKPENKHLSALVNLYAKCDKMAIAYRVFEGLEIKEFGLCRRLLAGFVRNGLYVEALKVYAEMISLDYGMSHFVVINALRACVGMRGLEEGRQIHDVLIKVENLMGSTSLDVLTELYSSSGKHEEALKVRKLNSNFKNSSPE